MENISILLVEFICELLIHKVLVVLISYHHYLDYILCLQFKLKLQPPTLFYFHFEL